MCKSLWRRAEALKLMGNHGTALCDYEKISQCRSDRWSNLGYKWMTELGTRYRDWGELLAEVTHRLKKYIIPKVHVKNQDYVGEFLPRARQASVQVGDALYIFGGSGMGEKMIQKSMEESDGIGAVDMADVRRYLLIGGEFLLLHLRTKKFEVLPWSNSWFSRQGSSIVHFDGSLYVFGGRDLMYCDQNDFPTGLARYDIKKRTWTFPKTSNCPTPMFDHSAVVCNGYMYIFGGETEERIIQDALWRLDFEAMSWEKLSPVESDIENLNHSIEDFETTRKNSFEAIPTPILRFARPFPFQRSNHGFWSDAAKNCLYVFGGCYEPEYAESVDYGLNVLSDLWRYDIDSGQWTNLPLLGNFPGPRAEFGMRETSSGVIIHGGFNHSITFIDLGNMIFKGSYFNDTFIFDNKSETWKMINYQVHDSMPKSMFASLGIYNGDVIAVGGSDACEALTDIHTLALNLDKVRAKISRERIAKCEVCNRSGFEVKLYNCSGCKRVSYCSRVHQKQDWKRHKHRCIIRR